MGVLSLSTDELRWTLSDTSSTTGASAEAMAKVTLGTGHQLFDVQSWLNAVVGNQEAYTESFEGTNAWPRASSAAAPTP